MTAPSRTSCTAARHVSWATHATREGMRATKPRMSANLLKFPDDVPDEKGLYLSDILSTSWHCVVDTGVQKGDVVAIWDAGPLNHICAVVSFMCGAKRVIFIDGGLGVWRLDSVKCKRPNLETIDFIDLPKGESRSIPSTLKTMEHGGPDVALECVAGEYAKDGGALLRAPPRRGDRRFRDHQ
ncbi:uncharacterized protein Z518_00154 [Rhinocladiella mackenziei CBS 650.93]|uniref:Uncharacterized protein n=1 Tax=Rhinocladiella mackenziei CBS 650.93 TaxID=1442369 RepID=A0A0D2J0C2_9EURO|nr:uncharacterized protein Z518_00154 [Rhinocladiella mackenziei CBS 650.93]KIX09076.1 hypothetical protein Z518_00154 [Rhinocladiella mackenziei CBS 650.93]